MIFNSYRALFYDLDTRTTFSVSKEQWDNASREFEKRVSMLTAPNGIRLYVNPSFSIETETGTHYRWIFRKDQDYCEEHVRGIR